MKKICMILIFCLFFCVFQACQKTSQFELTEVGQETVLYPTLGGELSFKTVQKVLEKRSDMKEIFQQLGIRQVKRIDRYRYTPIKTDEGLFLLVFSESGTYEYLIKINLLGAEVEREFSMIKVNTSLDDVTKLDPPDGQYPFMYASFRDVSQFSYHFFESGNGWLIRYQNDVITEIIHFTI